MLGDNRCVDKLGRICIPIEMRKELKLDVSDPVEITCDGYEIKIKKRAISCVFCNSKDDLIKFGYKYICGNCIDSLSVKETRNLCSNKNRIAD